MTLEEIGARAAAVLVGAMGVLGANRIQKARRAGRDPEASIFPELREMLQAEGRMTKLETRFDDMVRRMEEHDARAERERAELLGAIEKVGLRLDAKIDTLIHTVYERRSEPRA
jgi:hypothetical protein